MHEKSDISRQFEESLLEESEGCVSVTVPPHLPCGDHLGSGLLVNIINKYFLGTGRRRVEGQGGQRTVGNLN